MQKKLILKKKRMINCIMLIILVHSTNNHKELIMKKLFKGIARFVGIFLLLGILIFAVFFIYSGINDYKPEKVEQAEFYPVNEVMLDTNDLRFMIWNIGYCGLGEDVDFFYDGGVGIRPNKDQNDKYYKGVADFLQGNDSIDFLMLQEVDVDSKRTYHQDQRDKLRTLLDDYNASFIYNYDVWMVPMPLTDPLGKIKAGMMTLSKARSFEAKRYALPVVYDWPMKHFMLDRGFIYNKYPLEGDKELIVINVHNSAYVKDEEGRAKELGVIKDLALSEYANGNYVVIGGDWNMNAPDYSKFLVKKEYNPVNNQFRLPDDLFQENWQWIYDPEVPTNRSLASPFVKGQNETNLIDFYLLSPNIEVKEVRTLSQDFIFSDHEPVYLKIALK
jgi:endonuclease/exonuclease/phosphatase family metal-dependent hydrolase